MKTVCPHCHQEFPETPDEYRDQTLQCPSCGGEFVAEDSDRPRVRPAIVVPPDAPVNGAPEAEATSGIDLETDNGREAPARETPHPLPRAEADAIRIAGAILGALPLPLAVLAFTLAQNNTQRIVMLVSAVLITIPIFPTVKLMWQLNEPGAKIVLTPFRTVSFFFCMGIAVAIALALRYSFPSLKDWPIAALAGVLSAGVVHAWRRVKARAAEDRDHEGPDPQASARSLSLKLQLANGLCIGGVVPFLGVPCLLAGAVLLAVCKGKGASLEAKTIVAWVFGAAIQAGAFYLLFTAR